jgi:pyruvate/2-oxoglutarate dehydrogenase complex dihydrolipoamide acyltransferase (E2) component
MSPRERVTLLVIAAVIAVGAVLLIGLSGGDDDDDSATPPAAATQTATTPGAPATTGTETATSTATTPEPEPEPEAPLLTADEVTDLKVHKGDTVRFRVRAAKADEVHVHGYDIKKDLGAGETATMSFKADITGIFEIELEDAGVQIAKLTVEP